MFGLFRRPETPVDAPDRHELTLDLIEQVAQLRGQVRATEAEWDSIRDQIKKGYQRMEKAHDRLVAKQEAREAPDAEEPEAPEPVVELHGFAKKIHDHMNSKVG